MKHFCRRLALAHILHFVKEIPNLTEPGRQSSLMVIMVLQVEDVPAVGELRLGSVVLVVSLGRVIGILRRKHSNGIPYLST